MNTEAHHSFKQLKLAITETFLTSNSASANIEDWKGAEITAFQEDLFEKVKARVSEKWFYSYIKNDAEKLPRIDMLNLLSAYVGYKNWADFKTHQQTAVKSTQKKRTKSILMVVLVLPFVLFMLFLIQKEHQYEFCFYDTIKNEPIKAITLNIKILKDKQSPIFMTTDAQGCFNYTSSEDDIRFVVQSPYYKTDTIVRRIKANTNKIIKLIADDYALMLKFYTDGNITDWKKHRNKLNTIIADEASIYQFYKNTNMVEIYSKNEFIQKLTIPTQNLKQMEILDKEEVNGQIVKLKFMIH